MPRRRCVAVMSDLDCLDPRQRTALRGVRRFAEGQREWRLAIDPFAPPQPDWPMQKKIKQTMDAKGVFNRGRFL